MDPDVMVSLSLLGLLFLLTELTRGLLIRGLADSEMCAYFMELVSTFQLCCCTHELGMLSEVGGIEPWLSLTLTYITSVIHGLSFRSATGNPTTTLEEAIRAKFSLSGALRRIGFQFAAAVGSRVSVLTVWSIGLSELHLRHKLRGFQCVSAIHASLPHAFAVELACAFLNQSVITNTQSVQEKYRVHAVAAAITTAVYAGGSVTGAVFNPALAFSTQFPCSGNSFMEYCFVYWLGPLSGMMLSVLLWRKSLCLRLPLPTKKTA